MNNNEITVFTQNIQGNNVNEAHSQYSSQRKQRTIVGYKGFDLSNLKNEILKLDIVPDIISLTELTIFDIRDFAKKDTILLDDIYYKVFTPTLCTSSEACYETSLGTCLLVKKELTGSVNFVPKEATLVTQAMKHKNKTVCDIRECRIYSKKLDLEIISIYVKAGLSCNNELSTKTLRALLNEMKNKLPKNKRVIFLGDFNLDTSTSLSYFKKEMSSFKSLFKKYEPWYPLLEKGDVENTYTHIHKETKKKVKLDYIVSNITQYKTYSLVDTPGFTDHKALTITYLL